MSEHKTEGMTEKFIEERGYIKDEGVTLTGCYDDNIGKEYRILLLKNDSERLYMRRLLESLLNLTATILQDSVTTKNTGLGEDHIFMLKGLGRFMGYYIGSTSFNVNELKDYDEYEFSNRLSRIMRSFEKQKQ